MKNGKDAVLVLDTSFSSEMYLEDKLGRIVYLAGSAEEALEKARNGKDIGMMVFEPMFFVYNIEMGLPEFLDKVNEGGMYVVMHSYMDEYKMKKGLKITRKKHYDAYVLKVGTMTMDKLKSVLDNPPKKYR